MSKETKELGKLEISGNHLKYLEFHHKSMSKNGETWHFTSPLVTELGLQLQRIWRFEVFEVSPPGESTRNARTVSGELSRSQQPQTAQEPPCLRQIHRGPANFCIKMMKFKHQQYGFHPKKCGFHHPKLRFKHENWNKNVVFCRTSGRFDHLLVALSKKRG
jgi:hypothetical protein